MHIMIGQSQQRAGWVCAHYVVLLHVLHESLAHHQIVSRPIYFDSVSHTPQKQCSIPVHVSVAWHIVPVMNHYTLVLYLI